MLSVVMKLLIKKIDKLVKAYAHVCAWLVPRTKQSAHVPFLTYLADERLEGDNRLEQSKGRQ